jgi:AsnC-like ligand binding domain
MVHGRTRQECFTAIEEICKRTGSKDYKVLFSSKEYKKTPVKY